MKILMISLLMVLLSCSKGSSKKSSTPVPEAAFGGEFKLLTSIQTPSNNTIGDLLVYNGMLYGLSAENGDGTIYRVDLNTGAYQLLHSFDYNNGYYPYGGLIEVNNKLFGMTSGGGAGAGVIFSINPDGSDYTVLYNFNGNAATPLGTLTSYNNRLYGLGSEGGANGVGSLFSLKTDGSDFVVHYSFDTLINPSGELLVYEDKFFGITRAGSNGFGSIFSIDPDGSNLTVLHEFNGTDGKEPFRSLIELEGKLYGVTPEGGTGSGVIYSINPDGSDFTVIKNLNAALGNRSYARLLSFEGRLYGTTTEGSSSKGNIFSLMPDGSDYKIHHELLVNGDEGAEPYAGLVLNGKKMFGVTTIGGDHSRGTIFYLQ